MIWLFSYSPIVIPEACRFTDSRRNLARRYCDGQLIKLMGCYQAYNNLLRRKVYYVG